MEIKPYIDYLLSEKIDSKKAIELLKGDGRLSVDEKNLIYKYCYPRILGDRELYKWFDSYFKSNSNIRTVPDYGENLLLVEATRTEQYGRFMKHLFYAFSDPNNISPVCGNEPQTCPICGANIYEFDIWNSNLSKSDPKRKKLAFGSNKSSIVLCMDCLISLNSTRELINSFDPALIDWTKQDQTDAVKRGWEDIKTL